MVCPNCNTNNLDTALVCKRCGFKFKEEKPVDYSAPDEIGIPINFYDDKSLVNAYIGAKADDLKYGGWSFYTFFLGPVYVIYRKMLLLAITLLLIYIGLIIFIPKYSLYIIFGIQFIFSFCFKSIYLNHVKRKVGKIKDNNPGISQTNLEPICKKSGGTSMAAVVLIPLILIIILYFVLWGNIKIKYVEDFKNMIQDRIVDILPNVKF